MHVKELLRGIVLGLFGAATTTACAAESYAPITGQRHANFTLPRIDSGEAVSLSDYRGKKLLLVQFASW